MNILGTLGLIKMCSYKNLLSKDKSSAKQFLNISVWKIHWWENKRASHLGLTNKKERPEKL